MTYNDVNNVYEEISKLKNDIDMDVDKYVIMNKSKNTDGTDFYFNELDKKKSDLVIYTHLYIKSNIFPESLTIKLRLNSQGETILLSLFFLKKMDLVIDYKGGFIIRLPYDYTLGYLQPHLLDYEPSTQLSITNSNDKYLIDDIYYKLRIVNSLPTEKTLMMYLDTFNESKLGKIVPYFNNEKVLAHEYIIPTKKENYGIFGYFITCDTTNLLFINFCMDHTDSVILDNKDAISKYKISDNLMYIPVQSRFTGINTIIGKYMVPYYTEEPHYLTIYFKTKQTSQITVTECSLSTLRYSGGMCGRYLIIGLNKCGFTRIFRYNDSYFTKNLNEDHKIKIYEPITPELNQYINNNNIRSISLSYSVINSLLMKTNVQKMSIIVYESGFRNAPIFNFIPEKLEKIKLYFGYIDKNKKIEPDFNAILSIIFTRANIKKLYITSHHEYNVFFDNIPITLERLILRNINIEPQSKIPFGINILQKPKK